METLQVRFLGSGDAFGSGGRLQTCIWIKTGTSTLLLDYGASALIGMRRCGVAPNDIDLILLTHLHGDHFGGLPFFLLDAQLISKRTRPLLIVGPPGTQSRVKEAMEVFFPGSSQNPQKFSLDIQELAPDHPQQLLGVTITAFGVQHPAGALSFALRLEFQGKSLCYTGDTQWTETLVEAARDVDLLIAKAYFFEKRISYHLDLRTLLSRMDELKPKRLIVTHMSQDMLARLEEIPCEYAEDGKLIEI